MFSNASNLTNPVDQVFLYIIGVCLVMLAGVTGVMIYFAVRYSRRRNRIAEDVRSNTVLEVTWVVLPTILVFSMFFYGWEAYRFMKTPPAGAMPVKVTGRQWSWMFEYENGKKSGELTVPMGRAVRLDIRSADVIHGLSIPAFRVKQDAVPGAETHAWFVAQKAGSYAIYCSMFCGDGHSRMLSKVTVLPGPEFQAWVGEGVKAAAGAAERGAKIAQDQGCLGCHSIDGSPLVGPTLKGLVGRKTEVVTAGAKHEIVADEAYIRRSVLTPKADLVEGFPDVMPPFQGVLKDEDVSDLVEYLKSLK